MWPAWIGDILKSLGLDKMWEWLNGPNRGKKMDIKVNVDERKGVEHVEDAPVREATREFKITKIGGKTERVEDKNEKRDERRDDKKEYGPFHRIKKRRDERRIDKDTK